MVVVTRGPGVLWTLGRFPQARAIRSSMWAPAWFLPGMNAPFVFANLTPGQLFTMVLRLAWEVHGQSVERQVPDVALDLVVAIGELQQGPWREVDDAPMVLLPMTLGCSLLDVLLDELERVTPGFGARVAIAQARAALDPFHAGTPRRKGGCGFCPLQSAVCCLCLYRPNNTEEL